LSQVNTYFYTMCLIY